jgi:hypothetical protein
VCQSSIFGTHNLKNSRHFFAKIGRNFFAKIGENLQKLEENFFAKIEEKEIRNFKNESCHSTQPDETSRTNTITWMVFHPEPMAEWIKCQICSL